MTDSNSIPSMIKTGELCEAIRCGAVLRIFRKPDLLFSAEMTWCLKNCLPVTANGRTVSEAVKNLATNLQKDLR